MGADSTPELHCALATRPHHGRGHTQELRIGAFCALRGWVSCETSGGGRRAAGSALFRFCRHGFAYVARSRLPQTRICVRGKGWDALDVCQALTQSAEVSQLEPSHTVQVNGNVPNSRRRRRGFALEACSKEGLRSATRSCIMVPNRDPVRHFAGVPPTQSAEELIMVRCSTLLPKRAPPVRMVT